MTTPNYMSISGIDATLTGLTKNTNNVSVYYSSGTALFDLATAVPGIYDVYAYVGAETSTYYNSVSCQLNGVSIAPEVKPNPSTTWHKIGTLTLSRTSSANVAVVIGCVQGTIRLYEVYLVSTGSPAPAYTPLGTEGYRHSSSSIAVPTLVANPRHVYNGQNTVLSLEPLYENGASSYTYKVVVNGVTNVDYGPTANTSTDIVLNFDDLAPGNNDVRVYTSVTDGAECSEGITIIREADQRTLVERTFYKNDGGYTTDANVMSLYTGSKLVEGASSALITTTDTTSIDLAGYADITGLDVVGQGAKFLVSFDGRETWYTFENSMFVPVQPTDIQNKGMLISTLKNVTAAQWATVFTRSKLDIMVDITSTANGWGDRGTQESTNLTYIAVQSWSDDKNTYQLRCNVIQTNCAQFEYFLYVYSAETSTWSAPIRLTQTVDGYLTYGSYGTVDSSYENTFMWGDASTVFITMWGHPKVIQLDRATNTFTEIAGFKYPRGIWADANNLYVANWINTASGNVIAVNRATGAQTTVNTSNQVPYRVIGDKTHVVVTNDGSNSVSIITKSDMSIVNINNLSRPRAVWMDDTHIYFLNYGSNSMTRITRSDNSTTSTTLGIGCEYVTGDLSDVYVSSISTNTLYRVNRATNAVTAISMGSACRKIILTATTVYAACDGGYINCVSKANNRVTTLHIGTTGFAAMSFDLLNLYVSFSSSPKVFKVAVGNVDLLRYITSFSTASTTMGLPTRTLSDDKYLYVAGYTENNGNHALYVYDKETLGYITSVSIPCGCHSIYQDASYIYVSVYGFVGNTSNPNLYIIRKSDWKLVNTTSLGSTTVCYVHAYANSDVQSSVIADDSFVYAADYYNNFVTVVNKSTYTSQRILTNITCPTQLSQDASYVYVGSYDGSYIYKIVKGALSTIKINVVGAPISIFNDDTNVYVVCATGLSVIKKSDNSVTNVSYTGGGVLRGTSNSKYVFGMSATKLFQYDIAEGTVSVINIPMLNDTTMQPTAAFADENYVYMGGTSIIVVYNVNTGSIYPYQFPANTKFMGLYSDGKYLYAAGNNTNTVYRFDLRSTPFIQAVTVVLPKNQAPVIKNPILTPNSLHIGNVVLTANVEDLEGGLCSYRVLINGVEYRTWSLASGSSIDVSMTIPYSALGTAGVNAIRLEARDEVNLVSAWDGYITLVDEPVAISATYNRALLNFALSDADNEAIYYRVLMNGVQVFPSNDWADYTGNVSMEISKTLIQVGIQNTIRLEAKDAAGVTSVWTQDFIGTYIGLMFVDSDDAFYSDDLCNRLKYFDFGTITAGQTTLPTPVYVKNMTGLAINNVRLAVDLLSLPAGSDITVSPDSNGTLAGHTLTLPNTLADGDAIDVYLIASTSIGTSSGGKFKVDVRADLA